MYKGSDIIKILGSESFAKKAKAYNFHDYNNTLTFFLTDNVSKDKINRVMIRLETNDCCEIVFSHIVKTKIRIVRKIFSVPVRNILTIFEKNTGIKI